MNKQTISGIMLTLLLIGMLMLAFKIEPVAAEPRTMIVGVAKYYDNRKCVVTFTLDDYWGNTSHVEWDWVQANFTAKGIYYSIGAVVVGLGQDSDPEEWDDFQEHIDAGYAEVACHSWDHPRIPYSDYEKQINQSKWRMIRNLTFPWFQSYGSNEYVYAWIEPYAQTDSSQRAMCGDTYYLCDRDVSTDTGFANWDSTNGLYNRVGYKGNLDGSSLSTLNSNFDSCYTNGQIYHAYGHPNYWDTQAEKNKISDHLDHIKDNSSVWYVPFGLLYLYHWVDTQNIVNITSTGSGLNKVFKLSVDATDHLNYGVSYPITYVFDIPSNWISGYVYYRYLETDPWTLMGNKSSGEFFNGIDTSRFDFANNKAYISIGFSNVSHNIYLQLRQSNSPPTIDSRYPLTNPTIQEGESQEFNITKSDLDGDPLTVTWWLNQSDTGETSDSYTYTANYESAGTYNVTVTVSDGLSQTSHQWTLTVTNVERGIAITNLISSKNIVGQGYSTSINITIINQGELTETFNLTAYANTTEIETREITLTSGNSTTVTFTWNTTGVTKGNYAISANATIVPGETDLTDNTYINGEVYIGIPGDLDAGGDVDPDDLDIFVGAYGTSPLSNPNCDIDSDGDVDPYDFHIFSRNYGKTDP